MMTSALKIRWSGSAFKKGSRFLAAAVLSGSLAACAHTPGENPAVGDRVIAAGGSHERGSVHFSVHAPEADGVTLILMKSLVLTPVVYEVRATRTSDGIWSADLDLIPGEYRYFFLVDGSVTVNGDGGRVEQDDFGGVTGVLTVDRTPDGQLRAF